MGLRKKYIFVCVSVMLILSGNSFSGTCREQFEYVMGGGSVGDDRIYNSLEINAGGSCYFYSLKGECNFKISKELYGRITAMGMNIIRQQNNADRKHFITDSLTSFIRVTKCKNNNTTIFEAAFYADNFYERKYPEQKRPDEFLEMENILIKQI